MIFKRIKPGYYLSADQQVEIIKEFSQQTGRPTEVIWTIFVKGAIWNLSEPTLREAKEAVQRFL